MRYLLVGNSFASIFAIEAIRVCDEDSEITVVSDEDTPAYSRALIHEYLSKAISSRFMYLRGDDFYKKFKVKLLTPKRAISLDAENKELVLETGEKLRYDRLLLAVGGMPFIPPGISGLDRFKDFVFTFTKWKDAKELDKALSDAQNVVVIGAGLIGMQAAEAIAHRGKIVNVVELADHILPMVVDEFAGRILQEELEDKINFHTSDSVEELIGNSEGKLTAVRLKSGKELPSDVVVIAVGVRPNVGWLKDSGVDIDRGIVVDDRMKTSLPDVYAAGDCAQGLEIISGSRMVLATIPIASEQGYIAGLNMAGRNARYRGGIPLNAMQLGSIQVISYGYVKESATQEVMSIFDEKNRVYKKIVLEDGRITGVLLMRCIDRAGIYRYLIENRIDVSSFKHKLLDIDLNIAALPYRIREDMFLRPQTRISIEECIKER